MYVGQFAPCKNFVKLQQVAVKVFSLNLFFHFLKLLI